jgi:FMN hydrolase / 5-amino-6-(5-phospho-D-ribitylamino)uracil phosphatase
MSRIEVVTFDLDNTLWDVESVIRNAERVTRSWFDVHVPELNATLGAADFAVLRRQLVAEHPELAHNLSRLREAVFARAIMMVGRTPAEAERLAASAFALFLNERHKIIYFDGAIELLDALARRHRLGALTNGNANITRLGLDRYFGFAFSAADVGASKPAPEMFRAALEHTGTKPAQVVHVGDNLLDDVHGATQLGIATIWVKRTDPADPPPSAPTHVVTNLAEVPDALAAIGDAIRSRAPQRTL